MFDHQQVKKNISRLTLICRYWIFLFWIFLSYAAAGAQEYRGAGASPSGSEVARRAPSRTPNIIADNVDRAAASADQLLEVLNREVGLMVEFKRLLAQDAGVSGQILEESDLTDVAITERLHTDLRARALATRLLQRYGYLVPRVNPESDLAAEQKLVRQERAEILARAAERRDTVGDNSNAVRTAGCDQLMPECAPQGALPEDRARDNRESLPLSPDTSAPAQRFPEPLRADESSPGQMTPDSADFFPDQRSLDSAGLSPPETMLAATRVDMTSPQSAIQNMKGYGSEGPSRPSRGQSALPPLLPQPDLRSSEPERSRTMRRPEEYPAGRNGSGRDASARAASFADAAEAEQGRMVHRPNPYADVPSLYDLYVQASSTDRPLDRFGLDVFKKGTTNPDYIPMDLPVGPSYVVGPGDNLSIDLWGGVSQRLVRTVDREGRVALPEVGPTLISGQTLGDVQQLVQHALRTQFRDVSVDVGLLRLRSVRVYVVGDVASPGAYDISSLSTPLNALFAAGGVTAQGSLRRIQHYRGKQLIEEVDAYDLLLHGIRGDMQRLENGDSLMVPSLSAAVTVEGMVRRPAIYELRDEKTLLDVVDLAGGILPAAALRHIEVQRLLAHETRTMLSVEIGDTSNADSVRSQMAAFAVQDGDRVHIFPIAPYNSESIYLIGHVLRPGRYSYRPEMKLTDLIPSYADLLPEPSTRYAEIIRLHAPEYRPVVEAFDLAAAFEHPEQSPKLEPLDTVHIFGRYDFESNPEIFVSGEVRAPGSYRTSGQQHLRDAVYQAGGVTADAWLDSAQLFRQQTDGSTRVLSINLSAALAGDPLNNVLVQARDRILVHRQPEEVSPTSVRIRGEVARPGRYPLAVNMSVSDLVRSAGGLLRSANPAAGDLTHYAYSSLSGDRVLAGHEDLDLADALAGKPGQNLPLRDGDVLTVPEQASWNDIGASVTLRGEVRKPGVYGIAQGERLSSLLERAGGLLPSACTRAAIFERAEVRELQLSSRQELIRRLEQESTVVKTSATTSGTEESALQQVAMQQRERALEALRKAPVSGRLVIRLRPDRKDFAQSSDDIELRAGDSLTIPKESGTVLVIGQVYNGNALTYKPGKNAGWYFARAGGATSLADKRAIFIVRADGSVTGRGQSGLWSGGTLSAAIGPGDTIVVPERPVVGSSKLKNVLAIAQIASSAALVAAVAIP